MSAMVAGTARADLLLQHFRSLADTSKPHHALALKAQTALHALPLPKRKQESWRYTPLPVLFEQAWEPKPAATTAALSVQQVAALALGDTDGCRIVLHNGVWLPALSQVPSGVSVLPLAQALADDTVVGSVSGPGRHLFAALNAAMAHDGVVIRVAAGPDPEQKLEILHVNSGLASGWLVQPRVVLVLEDGAQLSLSEQYLGHDDASAGLYNGMTEILLGRGARLAHARLQNEADPHRHLNALYLRQQADSAYTGTTLAMGGLWSRSEFHVSFAAAGAHCELNGFYLSGGQQSHDLQLDIVHGVPGCSSTERFKGILSGRGRAAFDGIILVQPDAQKTDARLSNDNLLLSRQAEIDTRPQLEIYADDVQCSHGTTVGQIDAEMLFYLRSRGIPRDQAVNMVCKGFAG
ncbi:MAG TPA: Fe-S cluster assembly protein SufD, partial [Thiolinea sp.]|nr:Fe-S cluster assembly protein SufD [Thiolinea sp.]